MVEVSELLKNESLSGKSEDVLSPLVCPPTCPNLSGGVCSISCAALLPCPAEPAMMARELVDDGEPDTRRLWGWKA